MTLLKQDPSAQRPCAKTMLGLLGMGHLQAEMVARSRAVARPDPYAARKLGGLRGGRGGTRAPYSPTGAAATPRPATSRESTPTDHRGSATAPASCVAVVLVVATSEGCAPCGTGFLARNENARRETSLAGLMLRTSASTLSMRCPP